MRDVLNEIKNLILSDLSKEELTYELENYHDSDIADVLEVLSEDERLKIYDRISNDRLANIFAYYEHVEDFIEEVTPSVAADIIEKMDSNEALDVLNELDDSDRQEIISLMDKESKAEVLILDSYDDDMIGSSMSDNYIVISNRDSIKSATAKLISEAGEHDNIFTIYVVDSNNKYYGAIDFKDLIRARKTDTLDDLIIESYPSFYDYELIDDCINKLKDYSENSIPILNKNNEIVGVITSDILIDMTEEVIEEDYAKLGGLNDVEDLDESVFLSIKKRIPWLIILLFLGLLVSNITGLFESVILGSTAIVFFQSTITDMAGNTGTQSLAVTIRNISKGESKNKVLKSFFKEFRIGFINGLLIAISAFLIILLFLFIKKQEINDGMGYEFLATLKLSGIISGSLLITMTVSNLLGCIFPIVLHKIHIDPAVASGPFITTLNDVVSIVIYYSLALILL